VSEGPRPSGAGPWQRIDPPELATPVGYAHAVESRGGRRITLAGQTALDAEGRIVGGDLLAQAQRAFANVAAVLRAAGARPEHLVRMRIFVTDVEAYRARSKAIGRTYREHFGRWFPAMTLVQVVRLYDPGALIEVESEAVVPDGS
jgi:enamine deaminase RidA (YjgF/YER057c/UK114 family)